LESGTDADKVPLVRKLLVISVGSTSEEDADLDVAGTRRIIGVRHWSVKPAGKRKREPKELPFTR
jgi:hypothetical protein